MFGVESSKRRQFIVVLVDGVDGRALDVEESGWKVAILTPKALEPGKCRVNIGEMAVEVATNQ